LGKVQMVRWLTGVLVATALLAAGCGGTTAQIGAGASSIVPASAPAFIAVDTDPASPQWRTIDALAAKFPDKQKGVDSIKDSLRKDSKLDWEKDVKPAIGKELDLVWLDFENNGQNFVGLMQPANDAKFKQMVAKGNASEKDPSNRVVYDTFRGWTVLASEQATIDSFEKASNSEANSLADDQAFKQSMQRLGKDAVLRAYVNGKFLTNLARRYGGAQIKPYLDKVGTLDWLALRTGATADGIGLDAIVHGTPGKLFKGIPSSSAFSPKLLGRVPENALIYLTFHGSKNMFAGLQKNALFNSPQYRQFAKSLADIGRVLEGENALYVRPGTARTPGTPFAIPEVTLISTPAKGTDGTAVIDRMVERFAGTPPLAERVDGTPVHAMADNGLGLYYANIDGKLVVTDQPSGIRGLKNGGKPLSKSAEFKDVADASGLPGKTYGFLYVDISSSIPFGEKLASQRVPAEIARNLKPLRSAVEYAASRTHELQVTFFLRIK
jgi:uncharacterized protein DUF3352